MMNDPFKHSRPAHRPFMPSVHWRSAEMHRKTTQDMLRRTDNHRAAHNAWMKSIHERRNSEVKLRTDATNRWMQNSVRRSSDEATRRMQTQNSWWSRMWGLR
jgi:hypothetical protein